MKNKLSIIIPVYNKKKYIVDCLNSVLTWGNNHNYEVIIIDDGSTDGSKELIDGFQDNEYVKIIHKENGGVSSARNIGLSIATGDYLTFVDADDETVKGSLDKVMPYLNGNNDIVIAGAVQENQNYDIPIFNDIEFKGKDKGAVLTFTLTGGTDERRIPAVATQFITGCKEKFYLKTFIQQNNIHFDEQLGRNEDILWSCQCYYLANTIRFIPPIVYINKTDPDGITKGTNIYRTMDNAILFLIKFDSYFEDKIDKKIMCNFCFHMSLVTNYEIYRAWKMKQITHVEFNKLINAWYAIEVVAEMVKEFDPLRLSVFKRIAYLFMKLKLYRLVGLEMEIHYRIRAAKL